VCILAKDPVTAKSPAYHDHLLHRILLNLLDATTAARKQCDARRQANQRATRRD
jgi:hypothetical protein